jgi:hypothetical protein
MFAQHLGGGTEGPEALVLCLALKIPVVNLL